MFLINDSNESDTLFINFNKASMDFNDIFNCNGKVNLNDWQLCKTNFIPRSELNNFSLSAKRHNFSGLNLSLFDHVLPASMAILNVSHFARCMEMQLKILERHESWNRIGFCVRNDDTNFYETRKSICDFVSYIRVYLCSLEQQSYEAQSSFLEMESDLDDVIFTLRRFFAKLRAIPDSTFYYATSNLGNKCTQPEFHLYHIHLELRWLLITIARARTISSESSELRFEDLNSILQLVFEDLVYISMKIFERISLTDLRMKTPYSCTCARQFWLLIQLFLEDDIQKIKCQTFWEYVNLALNKILNPYDKSSGRKIFWHYEEEKELPHAKNTELFSTWLIYHLTLLHGYNGTGTYVGTTSTRVVPNYEQIDKILKSFVGKGGKEGDRDELDEELRVMIPLLRVLVDEWWPARVQVISFLWDCFHRRLEQSFLLQTFGPWSVSIEKISPADILKQTRDRIDGNIDQNKESSYGMFLRFFGIFLRKVYDKDDLKLWNQVKGRIYSKFSKTKVQDFSEAGLYNFIMLFLTLAVTADTTNVCTVMLDLLPPVHELNNEKVKSLNLSWKGKLAVLLLYNENTMNLESISGNFTNVVNVISCRKDENSRSMMNHFVDTFGQIIKGNEKLENGVNIFIGGWIDRYLLECPKNRICPLMKLLLHLFDKCTTLQNLQNNSGVSKILDALWSFVASRVRQLVFEPAITGDSYVDIAKLAVAFTVEALKNPAQAKRHKHSAVSLFQLFTSPVIVHDIRLTKSYLVAILRKRDIIDNLKSEVKNFDLILIQAWIKCCILGQDTRLDEEMSFLKNQVSQILEIRNLFFNQSEILQFETNEESIFSFFTYLSRHRNSLKTEQELNIMDTRVRQYFNNIDKWALVSVNEESKETDIAFWIYRCIGTLILSCSSILYVKNQPNNALKVLVAKFMLPAKPQAYLKHLGKRIFSMILLGIGSLSARSDITLQALVRDLFEAHLPLLITVNMGNSKISGSLLQCFADSNIDFLGLMFEILTSSFIIVSSDNTTHKHCYLVMTLLRNLLKSGKTCGKYVVEFTIAICVTNVVSCFFKVHNLHPHKQQTLDFLAEVTTNPYYREDLLLQEKLENAVVSTVIKFIMTNSQCIFDFLRSVMKINIVIVNKILPHIERCIVDLEKFKRPNAASMRYLLHQLQHDLKNS